MEHPASDLSIRHVSKTYPNGVKALSDISLTIPRGMYGLLGPNGAGKSTLMRMLATLQAPDAGTIRWGEVDVVQEKQAVRASLGYLPQDFGLLGRVRAETLLDHFAILKGFTDKAQRREMVADLLHQVNLWDQRRQQVGGFSGGMRQRFGVAVALLGNPKLLIVDEPTAGLDPAERVRFLNLLSALGETSTVILSTHIVADVSELCTNMAIINQGRILLEVQPLRAVHYLEGKIWRRMVKKSELTILEQTFSVISTKLLSGLTLLHIYSEQDPGPGFKAVEPDLEDVYFATLSGHYRPAATLHAAGATA